MQAPVGGRLGLEPARERVGCLNQQELPVVVPGARGCARDARRELGQQPRDEPLVLQVVPELRHAPQAGQGPLPEACQPAAAAGIPACCSRCTFLPPRGRLSGTAAEIKAVPLPYVASCQRQHDAEALGAKVLQCLRRVIWFSRLGALAQTGVVMSYLYPLGMLEQVIVPSEMCFRLGF